VPFAQDAPDSQYLIQKASDISGGSVDVGEEHLIPANAAVTLLNIEASAAGRRRKLLGVRSRGAPGGQLNPPNGLIEFESPSFEHIVGVFGSEMWSTDGILENAWVRRASGVSLYNTDYHAVQGRGATGAPTLFLASAVGVSDNASLPNAHLVALDNSWGATLITDVRPRALAWYQSRLWGFNSSHTLHGKDFLVWSNVFDGRNFTNGQSIQIGGEDADEGTALIPLRGERPAILCFKERSVHLLEIFWQTDGFYPATSNAMDFTTARLRPIVTQTGCVGTRALTWAPGLSGADILFLSREGIRSLQRSQTDAQGGAGPPLSERIQQQIDRINWRFADRSLATHFNNVAYFAVPVDGSERPNFVVAYNTLRDQFFFTDWQTNGWARAKLSSERKLFYLGSTGGTDGFSGVTNGFHLYETERGNAAAFRQPIDMDEQTRAFTFPQGEGDTGMTARKLWRWITMKVQAGDTIASLSIQYKVDDDDDWSILGSLNIQPSDAFPELPIPLPFGFGAGRILKRSFSLHALRPGYKLQFRFQDSTSFARLQILEADVLATGENVGFVSNG